MLRQFLLQLWKEQNNVLGGWAPLLAERSPGTGVEVQGVEKLSTLEVVSLKEREDILTLFEMSQESKLKAVGYFPLKCHGRSSLCAS